MLISCNRTDNHPNAVQISGQIDKSLSKEILIYGSGYKKVIPLSETGFFNDTIILKDQARYQLMLMEDKKMSIILLAPDSEILISADASNFEETLNFKGENADFNNYMNKRSLLMNSSEFSFKEEWYNESEALFQHKLNNLELKLNDLLHSYENIESTMVEKELEFNKNYANSFKDKYAVEHKNALKLAKGTPSPIFNNYLNFNGGSSSLSDFKGKYVYIDVWATWCAPCKAQIPFLEKIEKEYAGKNIEFVSISVDKQKYFDKWKKYVADKNLSGIQLFASNAFESSFIQEYNIKTIPRFVLIDPVGKIISQKAPKPSNYEELKTLFSQNGIN